MQHASSVLIPIHIGELDLSITAQIAWTILASVVVIFFGLWARRRMTMVPNRLSQHLFELTVDFIEKQIVEPNELDIKRWTPLFLSLFLFIFLNNLTGILPGATSGNSNINQTMALAFVFFVLALVLRFKHHGPFGFFKSLIPSGVNGPVVALLFPIEFISLLFQPISLALRLFANLFGGHTLFITIIAFAALAHDFIVPLFAVGGSVIILLFELFVSFIQAYIFCFLSALMISEAKREH
jgi:F-type H+-transporting ATPase subunit a